MLKRYSRTILTFSVIAVVLALLVFAFWPKPVPVDIGQVVRAPMEYTITEEVPHQGSRCLHRLHARGRKIAGASR